VKPESSTKLVEGAEAFCPKREEKEKWFS